MSDMTPMMKQYTSIKAEQRDAILLFRMGDFYEMFFDDAKIASRVLGLALTTRDKGGKNPVPLAGVPHHAVEPYLVRLVEAGYKVAICDQVEDPKKAKGLVKREITEVITPGTLLSSSMLDERRSNYLISVMPGDTCVGLARVDLSTGEFVVSELAPVELRREILRAEAAELIVPEELTTQDSPPSLLSDLPDILVTAVPDWEFGLDAARRTLTSHFGVANLDGFGLAGLSEGIRAAGAAISYLKDLKKRDLKQITTIRHLRTSNHVVLDETSQRNLELVEPLEHGLKHATLLAVLDRTASAMGARLLRQWILYPLHDTDMANARLDGVEALFANRETAEDLRATLRSMCDLPRVVSRIASGHASPRDLASLRQSLEMGPAVIAIAHALDTESVRTLIGRFPDLTHITDRIAETLEESPPATLKDGGVIRDGHSQELDALRSITREGKDWIGRLQTSERERTGITSLKIGYNRVFGYYIEVTKAHADRVPDDYIRKQTLVNAERYITPDLKEYENRVLTAEEDMVRLEREIFESLREWVAGYAASMQDAAQVLAEIDVLNSLGDAAVENDYVRPTLTDDDGITIMGGRHPVVERLLEGEVFVPNDVSLDSEHQQILLMTGPNMAGKSTYLRQVALIVIMAQMGSFVPAGSASIGLVDRVFTRIGAQDALVRGRSTFLVEMSETANILNSATSQSLVLLDEIGRGTSTFDGLSIAWAVMEYIHDPAHPHPKTLFATHYHELTELEDILTRLKNVHVLARETADSIVFLRKVTPGSADQSYGIEVARLAGMPGDVITRAREVLENLEATQYTPDALPRLAAGEHGLLADSSDQLPLFGRLESEVERELLEMDLADMTPLEALTKLVELQKKAEDAQ